LTFALDASLPAFLLELERLVNLARPLRIVGSVSIVSTISALNRAELSKLAMVAVLICSARLEFATGGNVHAGPILSVLQTSFVDNLSAPLIVDGSLIAVPCAYLWLHPAIAV